MVYKSRAVVDELDHLEKDANRLVPRGIEGDDSLLCAGISVTHGRDLPISLRNIRLVDGDGIDPENYGLMGAAKLKQCRLQVASDVKQGVIESDGLRIDLAAPCSAVNIKSSNNKGLGHMIIQRLETLTNI